MIGRRARFAYAHGRLGARLGARPGPADWARLQAAADAAAYVDAARRTPVATLMEGVAPGQPIHAVEAALREQWRAVVDQVARWHSPGDRPAIGWLEHLPLLPAIDHLAGNAALPWMEADAQLAPFIEAAEGEADALAEIFRPVRAGEDTAAGCWLAHLRALWPDTRAERADLEELVAAVSAIVGQGKAALPSPDASDRAFMAVLRRNPQSLVASVAYLGLVGNDLRRLRGQVAVRLALPSLGRERTAA